MLKNMLKTEFIKIFVIVTFIVLFTSCITETKSTVNEILPISSSGEIASKEVVTGIRQEKKDFYFSIKGKEYGPYQDYSGFCIRSDGEKWGVLLKKDGNFYVIVNEKEFGPYKYDNGWDLTLYGYGSGILNENINGDNWAFKAQKEGAEYAIINDMEIGPFGEIKNVVLSSEPTKWIVEGRVYQNQNFCEAIILNKKYGPYENIWDEYITNDGTIWSLCVSNKSEQYAIVNGKVYGPYQWVDTWSFRENGGIIAQNNNTKICIINDKEYGPYQDIGDTVDGKTWAFKVKKDDGEYIITNEKTYGPFDMVNIGYDGINLLIMGYHKESNNPIVIINGEEQNYYNIGMGYCFNDCKVWAFEAMKKDFTTGSEQKIIVINGNIYNGWNLQYVKLGYNEYLKWLAFEQGIIKVYRYTIK